ncbi:MAG: MerR family DNA-binding transcriptional regulator [Anaerolineales bacterium]|nr:MerR family DNA-binding transcriptional regulator [Anaerolineales bacterium]
MPAKYLRTSQVAQAVGVHANTVRLYEEWGFLPPIPRTPSGYRCFTAVHLEQMRLARIALQWPYPGGKDVVIELIHQARDNNLGEALDRAYQYLAQVHAEQAYAEAAVDYLERWAHGQAVEPDSEPLLIGAAAAFLGVSGDMLRNWERNGLLTVPRDPRSGYRLYGAPEIGRARVIRVLRQAGYSLTAVLRMVRQFDAGQRDALRAALDTVDPGEDIYYVTDNWLTTLQEAAARAQAIIEQLQRMEATAVSPTAKENV